MKELEIKILEDVTNGTLDTNDILRKLLFLYGVTERYFYHYAIRLPLGKGYEITDELIECTTDFYDKIKSDKLETEHHKPVMFMSDSIPADKKLRMILYVR